MANELTTSQYNWVVEQALRGNLVDHDELSTEISRAQGSATGKVDIETTLVDGSNTIAPERKGNWSHINIDTASGSDTVITVTLSDQHADGDFLVFRQADLTKAITLQSGGTMTNYQRGDITLSLAGDTAIYIYVGGRLYLIAFLSRSEVPATIFQASKRLTSAEILALNTTPIEVIPAPGADNFIEIVSATASTNFQTAAYAANTNLTLIHPSSTGGNEPAILSGFLGATADLAAKFTLRESNTAELYRNEALQASVATGDPTTGDSDLVITVLYRILTLS